MAQNNAGETSVRTVDVESIPRFPEVSDLGPNSSLKDVLSEIERKNYFESWSHAFHEADLLACGEASHFNKYKDEDPRRRIALLKRVLTSSQCLNLATIDYMVASGESIEIKFAHPKFSLHDVVTFSPSALQTSSTLLYIVYQILRLQHYLHTHGFLLGDVSLQDVYVDDLMWLSVIPSLQLPTPSRPVQTSKTHVPAPPLQLNMTDQWVQGGISNFQYLMYLNEKCGRRLGNPNHHPILPWIMDFTLPNGGWRDFTKSKFRINKGDDQLDQTYEVAQHTLELYADDPPHLKTATVPHHISDILSEITYYTYKARVTDKQTLCQHVRQKWVPHEYPSSIRRLQEWTNSNILTSYSIVFQVSVANKGSKIYEWTPDECIPEFYTDPSIFLSIHDDLPDLEIPLWASSPQEFVKKHMSALESDHVSLNLHHWIDLTFGVKLAIPAAIEAKNVCLQLVDGHTNYSDCGIVQLFTTEHPEKSSCTKFLSAVAPEINRDCYNTAQVLKRQSDGGTDPTNNTELVQIIESINKLTAADIHLPPDYNPLELLERVEKDLKNYSPQDHKECECDLDPYYQDLLMLGCLITQLILPVQSRLVFPRESLEARATAARELISSHRHAIPTLFCIILDRIFDFSNKPMGLPSKLHAGALLAPSVVPFMPYLSDMYELITLHKQTDRELADDRETDDDKLVKHRLSVYIQFINERGLFMGDEDLEFLLPYIKQLMRDKVGDHCVQTVWYLFGQLSQLLGCKGACEHISPDLQLIYQRDDITDVKKIKLYHRTFIQQLIMQLGLDHFIKNIIPFLIHSLISSYQLSSADLAMSSETCDTSAVILETLTWLALRIGPVLSAKHITDRLLQALSLAYQHDQSFTSADSRFEADEELMSKMTLGDLFLLPSIKCLREVSFIYGEQFILLQYLPYITHVITSYESIMSEDCPPFQSSPLTSKSPNLNIQASSPLVSTPPGSEYKLLSCTSLLLHLIPCLTDGILLDTIEHRLVADILLPLISIISSPLHLFPSLSTELSDKSSSAGDIVRRQLAFRLLDIILVVSQRIGFDQTRRYLRRLLMAFFRSFEFVHQSDAFWTRPSGMTRNNSSDFLDVKQCVMNQEFYVGSPINLAQLSPSSGSNGIPLSEVPAEILTQLKVVFSPELAHKSYIQCCRLIGGMFMEELTNDDLIRQLCEEHEHALNRAKLELENVDSPDGLKSPEILFGNKNTNWFVSIVPDSIEDTLNMSSSPSGISITGNKLTYIPSTNENGPSSRHKLKARTPLFADVYNSAISPPKLKRPELERTNERHLKGDWIAYWEHELGTRESGNNFNFNQISLQTYSGHVGAVKHVHVMNNENSFITAGKDKTVRLWSLRNCGSGSSRCNAQLVYAEHKKPVFYAGFMETTKKVVSCDGVIQVWDPFNPVASCQYEAPNRAAGAQVSAVEIIQSPSPLIVVASTDSFIRFIDLRQQRYAHEVRPAASNQLMLGPVRGLAVADTWLTASFGAAILSTLDMRTGFHIAAWQCKTAEDFPMIRAYKGNMLLTCSSDGCFTLWRNDSSVPINQTKLNNDQISAMGLYDDSIVIASGGNRLLSYRPNLDEASFIMYSSDKLRGDIFKGTISSLATLEMNRQTIVASDNGLVHLYA